MSAAAQLARWTLIASFALASAGLGAVAGIDPALALVAAFSIGFLLVVMADLYRGLVLFTLVTLIAQTPSLGGAGLSIDKVAGILLALSWIATLVARRDASSDFTSSYPGLAFALILLVCWAGLSQLWAESQSEAFIAMTRLGLNAILFLIVFTAVRRREHVEGVMAAFVAGACFNAVWGLTVGPGDESDEGRLGSQSYQAGELAALSVAGLALSLGLAASWRRQPLARLAVIAAAGLCTAAVFLAGSRGALIGLGVSLAAFLIASPRKRGQAVLVIAVIAIAGVGFYQYAATPEVRERVSEVGSGSGRVDLWTVGWRMVEQHPLEGVGAGNFRIASAESRYLLEPGVIEKADYFVGTSSQKVVHNTYLGLWAELGIVGLALFLVIAGFCLYAALRAANAFARQGDARMELLARVLFVALSGALAAAFFASREYTKEGWLLLGLAPAVLAMARAADQSTSEGPGHTAEAR